MEVGNSHSRKSIWTITVAIISIFTVIALSVDVASAAEAQGKKKLDTAKYQAERGFTTVKDWNVKGENMSPRGSNPYYYPLKPGFRYIMVNPNYHGINLRIEVVVLDKTESFDIPGYGKFDCAIVQEEEFYDGVYHQQAHNWFCIDKVTTAMYAFGEVSWEIDAEGRKVFAGTWRVGDPDGGGANSPDAEPGMLMPATFKVGDKYVFDGHEDETFGYSENMEKGIKMTVPAGTFDDCVRVREYSLTTLSDITDKWYCKGVGIVKDTSDGELVASDALPGTNMSSFGIYHREGHKQTKPLVAKINAAQAAEIALKEIPGKVTSTNIERWGKFNVYVVEILREKDGEEWDVFVDIETGKVVGKEQ
jgi:hypothetical protein